MADIGWSASYDDSSPAGMAGDPMPDEPMTELGYARRLVEVFGGRLRYVPAWRRWHPGAAGTRSRPTQT